MPDLLDRIDWDRVAAELRDTGAPILVVLLLAIVAALIIRRIVPRAIEVAIEAQGRLSAEDPATAGEIRRRSQTLAHVFVRTADLALILVVLLIILSSLRLNIAPLLAGAGIAGIALGFGAQSLVRDLLSGVFIILENQYHRGDVVRIAEVSGVVEEVNLRRTLLRALDGVLHSVPNGEVRVASNMTRGWSRVNIDVNVGYREDLDRVRAVIDRVGQEMAEDPAWGTKITEAPKVLRVERFQESGVSLKVLATTRPGEQWEVAGELRRRIKVAFDVEGIEMPLPQRVVYQQQMPPREAPPTGVPPAE